MFALYCKDGAYINRGWGKYCKDGANIAEMGQILIEGASL
jgi:hypothetical protein